MSEHMFFVAVCDDPPGSAYAACVADIDSIVKGFYRKHAGAEIRKVNGDEMKRMLDAYCYRHHPSNVLSK